MGWYSIAFAASLSPRTRTAPGLGAVWLEAGGGVTSDGILPAGDQLLRILGDRLLETVGGSGTAARVGGDEFVVVCGQSGDSGSATELADRILARIEEPCVLNGHLVRVGVSIGVALGSAGDEAAAMISRADAAMYVAKQRGGSRHELYRRDSRSPAPSPLSVPLRKTTRGADRLRERA